MDGTNLRTLLAFEAFGKLGEPGGDVASDISGVFGWVERVWVEPDGAEGAADFFVAQVLELDAKAAWVGEGKVVLAPAAEVGVEVETESDVDDDDDDDQERWPLVGDRFGVAFGLFARGLHHFVPGGSTARCGAAEFFGGLGDGG